jgi:VanZ family protein
MALRYLDLAVLAVALPIFLALGMPLVAWAGVTALWLVQRAVQQLVERRALASDDPTRATAALAISMFARVWIFALAIFVLGKTDRDAGLSAALLAVVLVTVYLTSLMTSGPLAPGSRR